ncbi:hypothetical protein C0L75_03225 [Clostridium perfringens]
MEILLEKIKNSSKNNCLHRKNKFCELGLRCFCFECNFYEEKSRFTLGDEKDEYKRKKRV